MVNKQEFKINMTHDLMPIEYYNTRVYYDKNNNSMWTIIEINGQDVVFKEVGEKKNE